MLKALKRIFVSCVKSYANLFVTSAELPDEFKNLERPKRVRVFMHRDFLWFK